MRRGVLISVLYIFVYFVTFLGLLFYRDLIKPVSNVSLYVPRKFLRF